MAQGPTQAAPTSNIIGHVCSQAGSMLGSAKVTCDGKETLTLFDGTYKFEKIPARTYTITARLKGFKTESKTVTVKENETTTVDFNLTEAIGTAKICGHIYDSETKQPIPNATLILILPASNKYTVTNRNGYYEFTNLVEDTYDIHTSIVGYVDNSKTVVVKEGETKAQDFYCTAAPEEVPWG